ncbi:hypothetical protein Trydic_g21750 [Trypoxylus dichotomus]
MSRLWILLPLIFAYSRAFIIPNELPTILSLVYSNIPTIKKGTDSRLGWGFRLGNRADFQVLVELGPQTNTQPLGDQPQATNSKRNPPDTLANVLYAQRQHEKAHFSNTDGGKWLKEWSQYISEGPLPIKKPSKPQKNTQIKPEKINQLIEAQQQQQIETGTENPVLGIGEIDAKLVIPEDDKDDKVVTLKTTEAPKSTTSKKDALDNVAIDD